MTTLELSLGELEDLGNLLKNNGMEIYYADKVLKIMIKGVKGEDKAEEQIGKVLNYINQYGTYRFVLDHGKIKKFEEDKFEIEIIPRQK